MNDKRCALISLALLCPGERDSRQARESYQRKKAPARKTSVFPRRADIR
jgi:hypothetical protein